MGFIEDLDKLEGLTDEQKKALRSAHEGEVTGLSDEIRGYKATDKKDKVEQEITALSDAGLKNAPGVLKFVRRILLSDDEQPGLVLLSDDELHLSGDDASGKGREEITVAGAVRTLLSLMPRTQEGKLDFSDMALAANSGDRPNNDDEITDAGKKSDAHRSSLSKATGLAIKPRGRKRYGGPDVEASN